MEYETVELSCSSCKSRRNLTMLKFTIGDGFNVLCNKHYTDYLTTKIFRLEELVNSDKKGAGSKTKATK